MKKIMITAAALISIIFISPSIIPSGEGYGKDIASHEGYKLDLPKKIHRILSAEMNRIQNGMNILAVAIPAGHWGDITSTAKKMKDGYIMKKKLSKEEMNKFLHSLPAGYLEIDREFQKAARSLIEAAQKKEHDLVNSYSCKLNMTCLNCHSTYATDRFPGLKLK